MAVNPFAARLEAYRNAGSQRSAQDAKIQTALAALRQKGPDVAQRTAVGGNVAKVKAKPRSDEGSRSNTINQGINAVAGVADKAVDLAGKGADVITPFNGPLEQATDKAIGQGTTTLHGGIDDTRATATGAVSDVSQAIRDTPQAVVSAVKNPVTSTQEAAQQTAANVQGGATQLANAAQGGAQAVASQAQNLASNPNVAAAAQTAQTAAQKLGISPEQYRSLQMTFQRMGGLDKALAAPPGSPMRTDLDRILTRMQNPATQAAHSAAMNALASGAAAAGNVKDSLMAGAQNVGNTVSNAAQSVGNAVSNAASRVRPRW